MSGLLSKSNIEPGAQYNVLDFHNAIKQILNTNPSIHCVKEAEHAADQYLSEIKVCFNKQLELIDCNSISKQFGLIEYDDGVITNCHLNQPVQYPSTLPEYILNNIDREATQKVWRFPWVNLYKLIQIIKWFTL